MRFINVAMLASLLASPSCIKRDYNTLDSKDSPKKPGMATIVVESTSVRQLIRVIGIEKRRPTAWAAILNTSIR